MLILTALFSSTAVFCSFCRMNFATSGSASLFLLYQTFNSVKNDIATGALICLPMGFAFYPHEEPFDNVRID